MNLEKLSQPISSQSVEEHERMLYEKMLEIQLQYVDRLFSKEISPLEEKIDVGTKDERDLPLEDFTFLIERYSQVLLDLMRCHMKQKENNGLEWEPKTYDLISSQYGNRILSFYEKDRKSWITKTLKLLEEEREKANKNQKKSIDQNIEDEDEDSMAENVGLVNFEVNTGYRNLFKNSEVPGIEDKDTYISIHLDSLFKKSLTDTNINLFSSNSLEKLAVKIVDNFPETKAIIAESWLMDTPIAKRIGFKIHKRDEFSTQGSFWSQFINANGQIDNTRVRKFLETGKAPYGVALGSISTIDFLKKYLPKERKGKILLKDSNPDFDEAKYESDDKKVSEFINKWDTVEDDKIKLFLSQCHFYKEFNESVSGKGFFDYLIELKKENKTKEQMSKDPRIGSFRKLFKEYIKNIRFINKEVIIN